MEHSNDDPNISAEEVGERLMQHLEEISAEPEKWRPDDDEMSYNFKRIIESASKHKPDDASNDT